MTGMILRVFILTVIELLAAWGAFWISLRLGVVPPISLAILYAVFRTAEYYALKYYQTLVEDSAVRSNPTLLPISILLLLARIAGWGMLIVFAMKAGIGTAIALVVVAFIASLAFQTIYEYTIRPLRALGFIITLGAVPTTAIVILFRVLRQ
jgi:hypothetical protein